MGRKRMAIAHPTCRHLKIQSCCWSAFEVAAFQTLTVAQHEQLEPRHKHERSVGFGINPARRTGNTRRYSDEKVTNRNDRGGRSLTGPLRDARRSTSTRWYHSLSRRAKTLKLRFANFFIAVRQHTCTGLEGSCQSPWNGRPITPATARPYTETPMSVWTAESLPSTNSLVPSRGSTNTHTADEGTLRSAAGVCSPLRLHGGGGGVLHVRLLTPACYT
jgi:hypothetical protein